MIAHKYRPTFSSQCPLFSGGMSDWKNLQLQPHSQPWHKSKHRHHWHNLCKQSVTVSKIVSTRHKDVYHCQACYEWRNNLWLQVQWHTGLKANRPVPHLMFPMIQGKDIKSMTRWSQNHPIDKQPQVCIEAESITVQESTTSTSTK